MNLEEYVDRALSLIPRLEGEGSQQSPVESSEHERPSETTAARQLQPGTGHPAHPQQPRAVSQSSSRVPSVGQPKLRTSNSDPAIHQLAHNNHQQPQAGPSRPPTHQKSQHSVPGSGIFAIPNPRSSQPYWPQQTPQPSERWRARSGEVLTEAGLVRHASIPSVDSSNSAQHQTSGNAIVPALGSFFVPEDQRFYETSHPQAPPKPVAQFGTFAQPISAAERLVRLTLEREAQQWAQHQYYAAAVAHARAVGIIPAADPPAETGPTVQYRPFVMQPVAPGHQSRPSVDATMQRGASHETSASPAVARPPLVSSNSDPSFGASSVASTSRHEPQHGSSAEQHNAAVEWEYRQRLAQLHGIRLESLAKQSQPASHASIPAVPNHAERAASAPVPTAQPTPPRDLPKPRKTPEHYCTKWGNVEPSPSAPSYSPYQLPPTSEQSKARKEKGKEVVREQPHPASIDHPWSGIAEGQYFESIRKAAHLAHSIPSRHPKPSSQAALTAIPMTAVAPPLRLADPPQAAMASQTPQASTSTPSVLAPAQPARQTQVLAPAPAPKKRGRPAKPKKTQEEKEWERVQLIWIDKFKRKREQKQDRDFDVICDHMERRLTTLIRYRRALQEQQAGQRAEQREGQLLVPSGPPAHTQDPHLQAQQPPQQPMHDRSAAFPVDRASAPPATTQPVAAVTAAHPQPPFISLSAPPPAHFVSRSSSAPAPAYPQEQPKEATPQHPVEVDVNAEPGRAADNVEKAPRLRDLDLSVTTAVHSALHTELQRLRARREQIDRAVSTPLMSETPSPGPQSRQASLPAQGTTTSAQIRAVAEPQDLPQQHEAEAERQPEPTKEVPSLVESTGTWSLPPQPSDVSAQVEQPRCLEEAAPSAPNATSPVPLQQQDAAVTTPPAMGPASTLQDEVSDPAQSADDSAASKAPSGETTGGEAADAQNVPEQGKRSPPAEVSADSATREATSVETRPTTPEVAVEEDKDYTGDWPPTPQSVDAHFSPSQPQDGSRGPTNPLPGLREDLAALSVSSTALTDKKDRSQNASVARDVERMEATQPTKPVGMSSQVVFKGPAVSSDGNAPRHEMSQQPRPVVDSASPSTPRPADKPSALPLVSQSASPSRRRPSVMDDEDILDIVDAALETASVSSAHSSIGESLALTARRHQSTIIEPQQLLPDGDETADVVQTDTIAEAEPSATKVLVTEAARQPVPIEGRATPVDTETSLATPQAQVYAPQADVDAPQIDVDAPQADVDAQEQAATGSTSGSESDEPLASVLLRSASTRPKISTAQQDEEQQSSREPSPIVPFFVEIGAPRADEESDSFSDHAEAQREIPTSLAPPKPSPPAAPSRQEIVQNEVSDDDMDIIGSQARARPGSNLSPHAAKHRKRPASVSPTDSKRPRLATTDKKQTVSKSAAPSVSSVAAKPVPLAKTVLSRNHSSSAIPQLAKSDVATKQAVSASPAPSRSREGTPQLDNQPMDPLDALKLIWELPQGVLRLNETAGPFSKKRKHD